MISSDLRERLLLEFKTLFVAALLAFLTWDTFWLHAPYTCHLALCFLICYFICVMVDSQPPRFIQPPPNYTNFRNMVESVMVASYLSSSYLISASTLSNLGAHLISYLIYGCGLVSS